MDRFDMQERKIDRLLSEHNYLNGENCLTIRICALC